MLGWVILIFFALTFLALVVMLLSRLIASVKHYQRGKKSGNQLWQKTGRIGMMNAIAWLVLVVTMGVFLYYILFVGQEDY
jgi:ABC-type Fe3+ transport system permease subunit